MKALLRPLIIAFALCFGVASQAQTFTFTAIPDEDESRLMERFNRVADYLAGELGVDVRYIPVKSYAAAVTAFRNNQVQLAWFGGLTGVQARRQVPGSQAIAQGFEDQSFITYFIAHRGAGIPPVDPAACSAGPANCMPPDFPRAIAGKTFTFGSQGSTSGRLMPEYHIRRQFSRPPGEVFERVGFSGDHSLTIRQVQSGAYQVGAVNYKVWENELEAGRIDPERVHVIWWTPPYPDYQWTLRGDVDERFGSGFKAKVRDALLNMEDSELLASFPRRSFVPADNDDYRPIEAVAREIGILE